MPDNEMEGKLGELIDQFRANGKLREGLIAMARVLHIELGRVPDGVPHASLLDDIMRAVCADIAGGNGPYVVEKLTAAYVRLMEIYEPEVVVRIMSKGERDMWNKALAEQQYRILFPDRPCFGS